MKFKSLFFYPYAPMGYIKIIVGSIAPKQLDNNFIPVYKNLIYYYCSEIKIKNKTFNKYIKTEKPNC